MQSLIQKRQIDKLSSIKYVAVLMLVILMILKMSLLSEGQIKCFCFRIETHSFSLTLLLQHYCGY